MMKLIVTFKEETNGKVTVEHRVKGSKNITGGEIKASTVFNNLVAEYLAKLKTGGGNGKAQ